MKKQPTIDQLLDRANGLGENMSVWLCLALIPKGHLVTIHQGTVHKCHTQCMKPKDIEKHLEKTDSGCILSMDVLRMNMDKNFGTNPDMPANTPVCILEI